jgi:hypothetical protein
LVLGLTLLQQISVLGAPLPLCKIKPRSFFDFVHLSTCTEIAGKEEGAGRTLLTSSFFPYEKSLTTYWVAGVVFCTVVDLVVAPPGVVVALVVVVALG